VARSIADAIAQNTSLDTIRTFNRLSSQATKVLAIEHVIDLYPRLQSNVTRHKCLLTVARLLEELASTAPLDHHATFLSLARRCLDLDLTSQLLDALSALSLWDLAAYLSSNLRIEAARHLRTAILELCPPPESGLAVSRHDPSSFRSASIRILAPARFDLGMGGMSDIPPYSLERYGNCVNAPIRLNRHFPLEATARILDEPVLQFVSKGSGETRVYRDISEFDEQPETLLFHREVFRFFVNEILDLDSAKEVYNLLHGGVHLETYSHLPMGTGLGMSSLLFCALLKALGGVLGITFSSQTLFVTSVYLENVAGIGGGWEDATAIYPGVKLMESFPDSPLSPQCTRLSLSEQRVRDMQKHLILIYTGLPKQSQAFFASMVERYCLGDTNTLVAIERNNALNKELSELLVVGDLADIGKTIRAQWENWKVLTEGNCSTPEVDHLFAQVEPYVYGARMNGAGQGGCATLMAREGKKEKLANVIRSVLGDSAVFYRWEPIL